MCYIVIFILEGLTIRGCVASLEDLHLGFSWELLTEHLLASHQVGKLCTIRSMESGLFGMPLYSGHHWRRSYLAWPFARSQVARCIVFLSVNL